LEAQALSKTRGGLQKDIVASECSRNYFPLCWSDRC
jgi:hypothetical protein